MKTRDSFLLLDNCSDATLSELFFFVNPDFSPIVFLGMDRNEKKWILSTYESVQKILKRTCLASRNNAKALENLSDSELCEIFKLAEIRNCQNSLHEKILKHLSKIRRRPDAVEAHRDSFNIARFRFEKMSRDCKILLLKEVHSEILFDVFCSLIKRKIILIK